MDWRKIGRKILFPPLWVMLLLAVFSVVALIYVFVKRQQEAWFAYVVYVLAFYTLSTICVFLCVVLPERYRQIKQRIHNTDLGHRYLTDGVFRTRISLYASLGINLLYVGVNALSYILYSSMWFVVLAVYYGILAVMRFLLVRYVRIQGIGRNRQGELRSNVICSGILLSVNFVLSGAVLMILYQDKGFEYHGILIYLMAAYTFYTTTLAIVNLIKYRKYNSPVVTTTKVISLSAALVSMLTLETAMFSQFGQQMPPENQRLMIILTGAGVSIAVVTMSVYMMVKSIGEIRKIRSKENGK